MYGDHLLLSNVINQVECCIGLGGIRGTMLPAMIRDVFQFFCEKCFILNTSSKIIQHNLGPIVVPMKDQTYSTYFLSYFSFKGFSLWNFTYRDASKNAWIPVCAACNDKIRFFNY